MASFGEELEHWRPETEGGGLKWGMRFILVLIAAGALVSVAVISVVQQQVIEGFRDRERATYLVGAITQRLFLLRIFIRQTVQAEASQSFPKLDQTHTEIKGDLDELFALLGEPQPQKSEIEALVDELFNVNIQIMRAYQNGEHEKALRFQNATLDETTGILERLNALYHLSGQRLQAELDGILVLFKTIIWVDSIIALVLWIVTLHVWKGQNRQMDAARLRIHRQLRQLELANEDLDAFAGRIAHDFKNLLTPVLLSAEKLEYHNDTGIRTVGERIRNSVEQSLRLIHALLAFARVGHQSEQHVADARSVAQAVRKELLNDPKSLATKVTITIEEVPPVRCSPELLFVIFYNLIGNAIKFTQPKTNPEVSIVSHAQNEWVEILVADNGPGINPKALPHVFEPFFREAGVKATGTGMGLPTVRRIVESVGGTIDVRSDVGKGTVFRLRLKAAQVKPDMLG